MQIEYVFMSTTGRLCSLLKLYEHNSVRSWLNRFDHLVENCPPNKSSGLVFGIEFLLDFKQQETNARDACLSKLKQCCKVKQVLCVVAVNL